MTTLPKNPTSWVFNPNYATNLYTYDSASNTYDSANQTYDGVMAGQSPITSKPVTAWTPSPAK